MDEFHCAEVGHEFVELRTVEELVHDTTAFSITQRTRKVEVCRWCRAELSTVLNSRTLTEDEIRKNLSQELLDHMFNNKPYIIKE